MSIILEGVTKRYGSLAVVDDVSLEIADGELFVLLGASGSGKSTILRLIAGLARPDAGRILLRGRDVTELPPQARGTGFVFQNYSLFRHMSVADNVAFGLKIRGVPRAERAERCEALLDLVDLVGYGDRLPDQLSGGQRQRVALARALAYAPSVLLLDEPFGALDAKIRAQLRRSLKEVHASLGVTTVLVTHDQEEAFELAERIGVVERGRLAEVGTPEGLYARPRSLFVATFVGAGTVLAGRTQDGLADFGALRLPIPDETPHEEGAPVQLLFRPEQVRVSAERPAGGEAVLGQGTVVENSFNGPLRRLRLRLPRPGAVRQLAPRLPFGEEDLLVDAILPADQAPSLDGPWVSLRAWRILQQPPPQILVYDPGEADTAPLSAAHTLAAKLGAAVTWLGVAESSEAAGVGPALLDRAAGIGLPGVDLRLRQGDPAEQIGLELAEALYACVVIPAPLPDGGKGPAGQANPLGRGNPPGRGLGVARALIGSGGVPVLVARGACPSIDRVLICTAAGEPGKADVRVGGWFARRARAAVSLLYVTPGAGPPSERVRRHLERAAATLRGLDVPGEIRHRGARTPAAGILAEIESGGYDLVVVGGHGPQSRALFGEDDVAWRVITASPRPVLVVPDDAGMQRR